MKKISLLLSLLLVFAVFASCADTGSESKDPADESSAVVESSDTESTVPDVSEESEESEETDESEDDRELALVSVDKPYTSDYVDGNETYPDVDGKTLTDGEYAPEASFGVAGICGFADVTSVAFVIDLQEEHNIGKVVARGVADGDGGLKMASTVTVEFSNDGETFTDAKVVSSVGASVVDGFSVVEVAISGVEARYVKVQYSDLQGWLFIDEIEVYA